VRKWTCIIAGGPDHGAQVPQWCEMQDAVPPAFEGSDGRIVRPITCTILHQEFRCVMMHPEASPNDIGHAVDLMTEGHQMPDGMRVPCA
jgi:hypothetical protein